jgi:hypothetical protein
MGVELASYAQMKAAGFKNGKAVCPQCGERTFVLYKDQLSGGLLPDEFGKCDRKEKCGFHHYPEDYFKMNGKNAAQIRPVPFIVSTPEAPGRLPYAYVTKSLANVKSNNNFISYLINLFDIEVAEFLINEYLLGVDKFNDIIFWQIDVNGEVRAGKTIPYGTDGKRRKDTDFPLSWVHAKAKDKAGKALFPDYKLEQCLFGEHLLNKYPNKPVLIFEGEKTAIVASVYAPFYFDDAICVATGSENGLSKEKLKVLAGRKVWVWPDAGVSARWKEKVKSFKLKNITERDFIDDLEGEPNNSDFVDFVEFDENGKALTIIDNLYTWTDGGEIIIDELLPFARNPIYFDFKYYLHKIKKAPIVSSAGGFLPKTLIQNEKREPAKFGCVEI